jgi:xanthine dehydrogenase accessory factor
MATEFFNDLKQAYNRNEPFVLCTVVETFGSSPGTVGQKMLVFGDGSTAGTIGGGINEERTRQAAMELFKGGGPNILTYDLANPLEGADPVCGGKARIFIELQVHAPRMVVFGAGHIGKVLAKMSALARFRVTIADERPEYATPAFFEECENVICKPFEQAVAEAALDKNCFVVVLTPGHLKDFEVLERVLAVDTAYVGLVCSAKKLVEMKMALVKAGLPEARVAELFAPVGINLGSTTPEEIAVEILAQIVAFRNGRIIRFEK